MIYQGKEYQLTGEPALTNAILNDGYHIASEGDEYRFELSASATDENGNDVTIYWIFIDIKGSERQLDDYDYADVHRVV